MGARGRRKGEPGIDGEHTSVISIERLGETEEMEEAKEWAGVFPGRSRQGRRTGVILCAESRDKIKALTLRPQRRYVLIYQYPPIAVLMALAANITHAAGVYCPYETKYYWAKIWVRLEIDAPAP